MDIGDPPLSVAWGSMTWSVLYLLDQKLKEVSCHIFLCTWDAVCRTWPALCCLGNGRQLQARLGGLAAPRKPASDL